MQEQREDSAVFSITAIIDLLGFANHLILASNDLRTGIGQYASKRLQALEDAIVLMEKERERHADIYPETFRYIRLNDAIIFGIDVREFLKPPVGQTHVLGFSFSQLEKLAGEQLSSEGLEKVYNEHFGGEGLKVAKFVGIVARIHNYINHREEAINMPGCRTVICSGLRYRIYDRENKEDYYSANFSLSNAYLTSSLGTKEGIKGNRLYMESGVARIAGLAKYVHALLAYSKYINARKEDDPYLFLTNAVIMQNQYEESTPFEIELFGKKYTFRNLNSYTLSNLQILPELTEIKRTNIQINSFTKELIESIEKNTPSLSALSKNAFSSGIDYALLFLKFDLEEDYDELIAALKKVEDQE
jgi:hypothetical protein